MTGRYAFGGIVSAALLAGCALQPSHLPTATLPDRFERAPREGAANWPSSNWYTEFGSSELDRLIGQAIANNLELRGARARIEQALERARQARAGLRPAVDALGNVNSLSGHSAEGTLHETDWSGLLSASYEVDFWGKNHAVADSAKDAFIASQADRDTLALTTLAAVANEYFQLLSLRERLNIAQSNVAAAKGLVDIVSARYQAGLANPAEVASQRAALAVAQLQIPELRRLEEESLAALGAFLGRPPEGFVVEGTALDVLHEPSVAPGLPAELLQRRPDIYTAEANLAAASADTVAARAAVYPSLNLTLAGGLANPAVGAVVNTLSGTGPSLNLGAGLTQPIFNAGKLRSQSREARAKEQEVLAQYKTAVVAALVDVENSLGAKHHLDEASEAQKLNVAESERAFEGARARYQHGSGDFLNVLEAQKVLNAARDQYALYRLARLQALVGLCKALGGGWRAQPQLQSVTP